MRFFRRLEDCASFPAWQHIVASLLVGLCIGFFSYIFFLQTSAFSRYYLLLGIVITIASCLVAYFLLEAHPFAFKSDYFLNRRAFWLVGLLIFLALPSYLFFPPYPELPFFQRESTLVITVKAGADPIAWSQFRKLYLNSGVEKFGSKGFQISGPWIAVGDDFILQPHSVGQIIWKGRVGQRASLAVPVPSSESTMTTDWDHETRQVPTDKSPYLQNKKFVPPFWYTGIIYAMIWIPLFFIFIMTDGFPWSRRIVIPALILCLGFIQANVQFQRMAVEFHTSLPDAIQTIQLSRHAAVLYGSAPNPWQYRVFSEWILEAFIAISSRVLNLENAMSVALLGLRVLQNLILLSLAYLYFIKLGITKAVSAYGVFLLAGWMLHAFYQSDLSFNTYFDVIFYLLAGILILDGKYTWMPALMIVAVLNRETSLLIPVLLLAWGWFGKPNDRRKALIFGGICLLVGGLVYAGLHLYYPNAPLYKFGDELLPGWELFRYNLTLRVMPGLLFQTLGFLPLVGLIVYRRWSLFVRICFLFLVPAWILIHAFSSNWAETRLFLVLVAMAFIPAVLPLIEQRLQDIRQGVSYPLSRVSQNLIAER